MKRYTATVQVYLYAENDEQAKEQAKQFAKEIDEQEDNSARVVELSETPFAKMVSRKVEL